MVFKNDLIMATGYRSDYPNQVKQRTVFPLYFQEGP